jgi:hypothetical protein
LIGLTYEVDACQLLECLKSAASEKTFAESSFKTVDIIGLGQAYFILVVGFDFSEFLDQGRVIDIQSSKSRKGFRSLIVSSPLDEIPRRLWKEKHAEKQNKSPCKLYGNWDSI